MSIRTRLILTLIALGVWLILPAMYGLERLTELRTIAFELQGRQANAAGAVQDARIAVGQFDRHARRYIVQPDSTSRAAMWAWLRIAGSEIETLQTAGYEREATETATHLGRLAASAEEFTAFLEADRAIEATESFETTKILIDRSLATLDPVAAAIDRQSALLTARAQEISEVAARTVWLMALLGVLLAILLGIWITRALSEPIQRLRLAMARVAEGEFDAPPDLPYDRPDELGDLCRSFRAMTRQLAELQRLRAEFFSVASHELKNPLNVIGGYAEILDAGQYGEMTAQQRESLHTITDQVGVLSGLVTQLLNMSRFEAGAFQLQMDTVNVRDLMAGVRQAYDALSRQQRIDLRIEMDPTAPIEVSGDVDRLRNEVLGNLLSNAFKFTPGGGRISVRARGCEGGLRVEVEDSGEGIPAAELERVFEKFYQHRSGSRSKGAGLGLAIARDIIEAHDGEIGVVSDLGIGTTVWFTLPVRAAGRGDLDPVVRDIFPAGQLQGAGG